MQVWIAANAWTYDNEDGCSPVIWGAFPTEAAAWAYIEQRLTGTDRINSTVWGPVELHEKERT